MKAKRQSSEVVVGLAWTKELSLLSWSQPSLVIVHRFWWDQLGWGRSSALSARIWVTAPGFVFIPWKQVLVLCSAHGINRERHRTMELSPRQPTQPAGLCKKHFEEKLSYCGL